jgi:hypothetical protein
MITIEPCFGFQWQRTNMLATDRTRIREAADSLSTAQVKVHWGEGEGGGGR